MHENNRPAMLAALREVLDAIESEALTASRIDVQNSASCAIELGWTPSGKHGDGNAALIAQVRQLWPGGEDRLKWRARKASKSAGDVMQHVVDVGGCEIRVMFVAPHTHDRPTMSAAESYWRCGSCRARLTKAEALRLSVPEIVR